LLHFLVERLKKDVCRLKKNVSSLTSWIIFFYLSTSFKIINIAKSAFVTKRLYVIQHSADSQRYPRLSCFICK